jgi:glycosyltransferase involved in cell wall biosynthesis
MIKWIGPVFDPSGYTAANRDYICALHNLLVDIRVQPINPARATDECNETTELIMKLSQRTIPYEYVMHHFVPERIHTYTEKDKINIAYNTWETTALPTHWVQRMNASVDAVFVPSEFNKAVYEDSGIKVPIKVIPHCLDPEKYKDTEVDVLFREKENLFKFLSVFQWTERKNPIALLKAYFSEFSEDDNVVLILKTYGSNFSLQEQERIKKSIATLKNDMNLKKYPPIYFVGNKLTKNELFSLYKQSDCFVLPTRGEGFGLPYAEAALCGNTVIATAFGGQTDFLNSLFSELIQYQLTPVSGMAWIPNYNAHMNWAEPDIMHLKRAMREMYTTKMEKPQIYKMRQEYAQSYIAPRLSYKMIGQMLLDAIKETRKVT